MSNNSRNSPTTGTVKSSGTCVTAIDGGKLQEEEAKFVNFGACSTTIDGGTLAEEEAKFVNYAARAWHEKRKEWIGDQSQKSHRASREPVISWTSTYDDLLATCHPFSQPIPLAEMVDFLVDIWQDEGLYG